MTATITNYSTILSCYCILISAFLIIRRGNLSSRAWPIFFFLACVIIYLVIDFFTKGIVQTMLIAGPSLLPFSFWLASKSLFSDEPIHYLKSFITGVILLVIYYTLSYLYHQGLFTSMAFLVSRVISLLFVILAIYEAQKGKQDDLIHKRKQLRTTFTYTISIIVLLTLMAELGLNRTDQELPKLAQRVSILIFCTYFLFQNTHWKELFFLEIPSPTEIKDHQLIDRIQQKMIEDDFYTQESLTIGKLAEALDEQEYKVRQVINQQLGYRNFTDFLNSYRITEARNILSDIAERKVTILEVSYKVGFNSIGPFNRAFKISTGLTPTEFRAKHLNDK